MSSNIPTLNTVDTTPFKQLVVSFGGIPTDFKESMTYYELLAWLVQYLDTQVIPKTNEAITLFNQLKDYVEHYFDNLDVQEEIDNKLDRMAEDGTLYQSIIRYLTPQIGVSISGMGCNPDGETDNSELLQSIINQYDNIYVDTGTFYCASEIYIPSNKIIHGEGTLKGTFRLQGEIGDTINYETIEVNKINTSHEFTPGDIIKVYFEDLEDTSDNHRQITEVTSSDGKLANNLLNYNNNYSIRKLNTVNNVIIRDITIEGNLYCTYCSNVIIENIKGKNFGKLTQSGCYGISILNCHLEFIDDGRLSGQNGSSNLIYNNIKTLGGNTPSDNAAIKLNETFYSIVENCNYGTPNKGDTSPTNGAYHAIMIDGDYTEDNYPNNPSQFITVKNCFIAKGFNNAVWVTKSNNITLDGIISTETGIQYNNTDNLKILNSKFLNLYSVNHNSTNVLVKNCIFNNIIGNVDHVDYIDCKFNQFKFENHTKNVNFINCVITSFKNNYVAASTDSYEINAKGCLITTECVIGGLSNSFFDIITNCQVTIHEATCCEYRIKIINKSVTGWLFNLHHITNSTLEFMMDETSVSSTTTTVNQDLSVNELASIRWICNRSCNSNNPNNFPMQVISKANNTPSDGRHEKGEIIWNASPSAGGNLGWICVTAGTPGTWKSIGTIEA